MNIVIHPIDPSTPITAEQALGILAQASELISRAVIAIRPADIDAGDFQILNDHAHELEILGAHLAACTGTRPMAEFSRHGPDDVEAIQTTLMLSSDFGGTAAMTLTRGALKLLTAIVGNGWASDHLLTCRGESERLAAQAVRALEAATAELANLLQRRRPRPA